jgi:hypothetical protein
LPTGLVEQVYIKAEEPASLWLFGNSTLDASVDEPALERSLGAEAHMFVLGSATFETMTRLARASLARTRAKPAQIAFFVSKDDFNAHGARASASARYLQAILSPPWNEQVLNAIPLYAARYSVRQKLRMALAGAGAPAATAARAPQPERPTGAAAKEDVFDYKSTYLANLGDQFEFDSDGFASLAALVQTWQGDVLVVHVPVTQAVWQWQDHFAPSFDSNRLRSTVRERVQGAGARYLDLSDSFPSSASYFKDAYHLRESHAGEFTEWLAPALKQGLIAHK